MLRISILSLAVAAGMISAPAAQARDGGQRPSFTELDANSDGQITLAELQARGAGRFAQADADGNGEISRAEMIAQSKGRAEARVDRMIARLDTDGNGALSQAELQSGRRGGGDRAERMFDRIDADNSGGISQAEFDAVKGKMGKKRGQRGAQSDEG